MRHLRFYVVFLAVGFLLTVPAFYRGLIPTDDIFVYSNWHQSFSAQLFSGEWYPRWLMDMNGGRGSSVFFFYPPLPFYASALVGLVLPSGSPAWFSIYLAYGLALGLSGIFSFVFLKSYTGCLPAFAGSLFYMLAPYHLFIDFYHRFAYPEFWAFTWAPLLFYFLAKTLEESEWFSLGLAVTYALLLLTHLPSFIILTPVLFLFSMIVSKNKIRILSVSVSLILGFAISAFYVLPMLFYQPFISLNKMWEEKYALYNNFLLGSGGFNDNFLLKIAIVNVFVLLLVCLAVEKPVERRTVFWLVIGFASVFLMFRSSAFFWDVVPLMNKIQFPWRLNILTLLAIVAVSAEVMHKRRLTTVLIAVVLLSQVVATLIQIFPLQKTILTDGQKEVVRHETEARLGVVEYLPRWTSERVFMDMKFRRLKEMKERYLEAGDGSVSILKWSPREIYMQVSSVNGFDALIRQFYFPNWQATVNDGKSRLDIRPGEDGLTHISIPPGQYNIKLRLVKGFEEVLGLWISLITMAMIGCVQSRKMVLKKGVGI